MLEAVILSDGVSTGTRPHPLPTAPWPCPAVWMLCPVPQLLQYPPTPPNMLAPSLSRLSDYLGYFYLALLPMLLGHPKIPFPGISWGHATLCSPPTGTELDEVVVYANGCQGLFLSLSSEPG